jgi:hypothetical protein
VHPRRQNKKIPHCLHKSFRSPSWPQYNKNALTSLLASQHGCRDPISLSTNKHVVIGDFVKIHQAFSSHDQSEKSKIDTNLKEVESYCRKYPSVQIQPITDEIICKSFEIDDIPE